MLLLAGPARRVSSEPATRVAAGVIGPSGLEAVAGGWRGAVPVVLGGGAVTPEAGRAGCTVGRGAARGPLVGDAPPPPATVAAVGVVFGVGAAPAVVRVTLAWTGGAAGARVVAGAGTVGAAA